MNEYTPIIRVQKNSHLETENIRIVFNERQLGHESYIAYMSLRIHLTLAAGLPKYQLEAPSDQGCFLFLFFIGPCPSASWQEVRGFMLRAVARNCHWLYCPDCCLQPNVSSSLMCFKAQCAIIVSN